MKSGQLSRPEKWQLTDGLAVSTDQWVIPPLHKVLSGTVGRASSTRQPDRRARISGQDPGSERARN